MSFSLTHSERRAIFGLSLVSSLRMIGLFMALPIFSVYAIKLPGATAFLMGIAMGIYGLCQALFQIPLSTLSDRVGRKPVIAAGLLVFALGSVIAGFSHSITQMIVGRALQGMGAVGGTILAMLSDLTREQVRTLSMAIAGMTIGLSFLLAMLAGPLLLAWYSFHSLFFIAGAMGVVGVMIVYFYVPTPAPILARAEAISPSFLQLLQHPQLNILNGGIFILHVIFTASFIVIPMRLSHILPLDSTEPRMIYASVLVIAFVLAVLVLQVAERRSRMKQCLLGSIVLLGCALVWLGYFAHTLFSFAGGLCLFFACFSILEALHPSLISRLAPLERKGSALGLYSFWQFLGVFVGGTGGGWLFGQFSFTGVFLFCIIMAILWLTFVGFIQLPHQIKNPTGEKQWHVA